MEANQEYIYRNTQDFELLDENTAILKPHDSDGVRIRNESGGLYYLSREMKGLRFSLEPNAYPRFGVCWKVSVNEVLNSGFEILNESGSQVRTVFVVFSEFERLNAEKWYPKK